MKKAWEKFRGKLEKFVKFFKLPSFAFVTAFLGAYAGSEGTSKLWRRAGIAVVTTLFAYVTLVPEIGWVKSLWVLSILSIWGSLSIGYGIPEE